MRIIKMKDSIIIEKDEEIDRLKKELYSHKESKNDSDKTFEIKKLLDVI